MQPIYNQKEIALKYGLRPVEQTGCGPIAVYNALALLGYRVELPALLSYFQRQIPLLHGNFGTVFFAPMAYFRHFGFPCRLHGSPAGLDRYLPVGGVGILFYRWHRGLHMSGHFAAVERRADGYWGYNVFQSSASAEFLGSSLTAFLKKHHYYFPLLLEISQEK